MDKKVLDTSAALAALLEGQLQLTRKYEQHSNDTQPEDSTAEEMESEVFIKRQTKFFDQLKRFLTAQQISLKQNLTLLETKTVKIKEHRGSGPPVESSSLTGARNKTTEENLEIAQESSAMEALHQWGNPSDKDEQIQVCPVCGLEFENHNSESDAFEDHVVGHWSSSEPI